MIFDYFGRREKLVIFFILFCYGLGMFIDLTGVENFNDHYAQEDGFVEYMTALGLLLIALLQFKRLFTFKNTTLFWKIGVFITAVVFFFGAGEEVSWGQRIFGIESGDFFKQNNAQQETNLHNLVVSGKKVNKIIFTQLLGLIILLYLLLVPVLYRKVKGLRQLINKFAIPVARWPQVVTFIVFTLFVLTIRADRKWELFEMMFALMFYLIFYLPLNKNEIYVQSTS